MSAIAVILAHSAALDGSELITARWTFWRPILPEVATHRALAHSAASSRARSMKSIRAAVRNDPAEPVHWGREQKGMVDAGPLTGWRLALAKLVWRRHRRMSVRSHWALEKLGAHKGIVNRVTETHAWQSMILTGTRVAWDHLLVQRDHPDAQPEFRAIAVQMRIAMGHSVAECDYSDGWHLPLAQAQDHPGIDVEVLQKLSVARCARESYGSHGSKDADLKLFDRLVTAFPPHAAPFEHVARPMLPGERQIGPHLGWRCLRHELFPEWLVREVAVVR